MSTPTFSGTALVTKAARQEIGDRATRGHAETMPGVNGLFFQGHGYGGRQIRVSGLLAAGGATPAAAHQALMQLFRGIQGLADGATVATYVGTDAHGYAHCVLRGYRCRGETRIVPGDLAGGGSAYSACRPVEATLLQLNPT